MENNSVVVEIAENIIPVSHVNDLKSILHNEEVLPELVGEEFYTSEYLHENVPRDFLKTRSVSQVIENEILKNKADEPFFVADLGEVVKQYFKWRRCLPRIEPFYAMKCNPDPMVIKTLHSLGAGFDCASKTELEFALSAGATADKIIFANPCKQKSHLRFAHDNNCQMMTFDNADELLKIKEFFPEAKLVLRILTDDSKARCQLGLKFGCKLENTMTLLKTARELELNVVGVSFHVGSGCEDAYAFAKAVQSARQVFDEASEVGFSLRLLDVGGGFPGSGFESNIKFESIATVLGKAVDEYFPDPSIRVISEPGRYFVSGAFTLSAQITSRRVNLANSEKSFMYYLNDGIYGSFNCIIFDHIEIKPKVLSRKTVDESLHKSSLWGPTCDSIDCLGKDFLLPELSIGDWFQFDCMGAYTLASASTFNGFKKTKVIYTSTMN